MRRKNHNVIFIVILFIMCLGIGYALIATDLKVGGTAGLVGKTWNVYFDNLHLRGSEGASPVGTPMIDPDDPTHITFHVVLSTPGDYAEIEFDIVNAGTVDAMISNGQMEINGSEDLPPYVGIEARYDDGVNFDLYQILPANETSTMVITLRYLDNEAPEVNEQVTLSLRMDFAQVNSQAVPRTRDIYVVNNYDNDGMIFQIDGMFPSRYISEHSTYQEALNESGGNLFLYIMMAGGHMQNASLGFVLNGEDYYLDSGGTIETFNNNREILMEFSDTYTCGSTYESYDYYCEFPNMRVQIYSNGTIIATEGNKYCRLWNEWQANCGIDNNH